eukprot:TRINITY_DN29389_c2_g2_i1.p1 TRINITY_DN29389_c2_g2~~TRINITY_DN29389_c2_g2_i1.p1  ORF type:complete len:608 (-),score=62.96 TRINITY_DN29389_c2_g2_i1:32-1855(-)
MRAQRASANRSEENPLLQKISTSGSPGAPTETAPNEDPLSPRRSSTRKKKKQSGAAGESADAPSSPRRGSVKKLRGTRRKASSCTRRPSDSRRRSQSSIDEPGDASQPAYSRARIASAWRESIASLTSAMRKLMRGPLNEVTYAGDNDFGFGSAFHDQDEDLLQEHKDTLRMHLREAAQLRVDVKLEKLAALVMRDGLLKSQAVQHLRHFILQIRHEIQELCTMFDIIVERMVFETYGLEELEERIDEQIVEMHERSRKKEVRKKEEANVQPFAPAVVRTLAESAPHLAGWAPLHKSLECNALQEAGRCRFPTSVDNADDSVGDDMNSPRTHAESEYIVTDAVTLQPSEEYDSKASVLDADILSADIREHIWEAQQQERSAAWPPRASSLDAFGGSTATRMLSHISVGNCDRKLEQVLECRDGLARAFGSRSRHEFAAGSPRPIDELQNEPEKENEDALTTSVRASLSLLTRGPQRPSRSIHAFRWAPREGVLDSFSTAVGNCISRELESRRSFTSRAPSAAAMRALSRSGCGGQADLGASQSLWVEDFASVSPDGEQARAPPAVVLGAGVPPRKRGGGAFASHLWRSRLVSVSDVLPSKMGRAART